MSGSGVPQRGDGLIRTLLFISQFCREARMSWRRDAPLLEAGLSLVLVCRNEYNSPSRSYFGS
jgi:hypothetical protein